MVDSHSNHQSFCLHFCLNLPGTWVFDEAGVYEIRAETCCFDSGSFTEHKIPSLVAHSESTTLLSEVTAFCDYGDYWLFKGAESVSVFHIATEKITHFDSGEELERFLVSLKLSTPEWKDLKTLYNERWKLADNVRQNPALGFWTQRKNSYGK